MTKPILAAMLSCSGTQLTDEEKVLFAENNPLGVTLFVRNLENVEQTSKLVSDIKNAVNRDDVLIALDEEGGRVSRLKHIGIGPYASAEVLGNNPVKYSKMHADFISAEMIKLGLNVNYAPVVDKKTIPQNPVLKGRCLSCETEEIIKYAEVIAKAYIKNGICPCIKHLPTHFSAQNDPHLSSLETELSLKEVEKQTAYLKHFSDYPLAMTAHIIIKAVDEALPITMSKKGINDFLRQCVGYKGFLLSDAIDMHALKGTIAERSAMCLDAGLDAVCYCSGIYKDMCAICEQKRFMTEKSLIRFAKIKKIIHNPNKNINVEHIKKCYNFVQIQEQEKHYEYDATEILNKMLKKGENL